MAMRRVRAGGGKPPVFRPTKTVKVGGVKKKFTGKGASGTGLGLHGKGRKITAKGYTGKGAYGYGQGDHGVATPKKTLRVGRPAAGGAAAAPKAVRGGTGSLKSPGGKPPRRKRPGKLPTRTVKAPRGVRRGR